MMLSAIAKIEIYKLFRHPMTLFIIGLALFLLSLLFYRLCVDYLQLAHQALQQRQVHLSLYVEVVKPLCSWSMMVFALVFPLFTTQAFSQEFKQKTFYLWAMSRQRAYQIVMGKFLSLLFILLLILFMMLIMLSTLALNATLNVEMMLLCLGTSLLVGSCFISLGLLISSWVANPLFSLGITYLSMMTWMLFEWLNPFGQKYAILARDISLLSHSYHGLNGLFYSPDILYFLILTALCLALCIRRINFMMTRATL